MSIPTRSRSGVNIATTPGKVIHETDLYQLIQYTPTTKEVLAVPLLIFPPWINRFYILDLNPAEKLRRLGGRTGTAACSWCRGNRPTRR